MDGINSRQFQGIYSLLQTIQTGSGSHPATYQLGTRVYIPWGKAAGAWN
jgi:hypothetical protein